MHMRRTRSTILSVAAVAALALTTAACDSASGSSGSGDTVKIGMSVSTLANPFFVSMKEGAEAEAKAEGVELTVSDAQDDASQQANHLDNFTTQGVKSIIINPVDSDAAVPSVKAAIKSDIPVIGVDRTVTGVTLASMIASDNVAGGKQAAEALAKEIGEKGEIVVLQGLSGTSASRDRGAGFTAGIKAFPNIKVVAEQPADFDRTKGLDVMTNLLTAHPNIVGVFAENDEMALGALEALGNKAGDKIKVVGFDGTTDGAKAIEAGTMLASIAQQPAELGKVAVQNAVKAAKGEKPVATVAVEVILVTKANAAEYAK
jgi:ABC-type sugar transport system substrate-binding protein